MDIKIKYLNWESNQELIINMIAGGYTGNLNNYRDINEYTINDDVVDVHDILARTYKEHNYIDEDTFCRLKQNQRSMCVGDLIYVDDDVYVVETIGFDKINI